MSKELMTKIIERKLDYRMYIDELVELGVIDEVLDYNEPYHLAIKKDITKTYQLQTNEGIIETEYTYNQTMKQEEIDEGFRAKVLEVHGYDLNTETFSHFFVEAGLPSNYILKLLEDNDGNIWCSCANDIAVYNIKAGKIKSYSKGDGMPTNEFGTRPQNACKTADGQLIFGAAIGAIGFYPEKLKENLLKLLISLKAKGKRIAAYGAAAKGSTMINYIGIGRDIIDFVVDRNPYKHGKYMPGKHLPIFGTRKLLEENPDYVLILAWNFAEEIIEQQEVYQQKGGKFIVPIPEPKVI